MLLSYLILFWLHDRHASRGVIISLPSLPMERWAWQTLVVQLCLTLWPHGLQHTRFLVLYYLPEFAQTHVHWVRDGIQPSHPLSPRFLPSIFPSRRVFPNELALLIRWPKYWSFSISPSKDYSELTSLGLTGLISLQSKELSRVFSSMIVRKHQFFSAQPSLWFNSHIHIWLLEKPKHWLYRPLSVKWCLCFLIRCLGWS